MKITVLGTGCIWTKRACASYLIDDNILLDVGSGSLKQLFKTTKNLLHHEKIGKIKLILITHFHLDHYFDIVPFLWKLASDRYPEFSTTIICPPDGEKKIKNLCQLGLSKSSFNKLNFNKINFVDASSLSNFKFGDYEISSLKMEHGDIDAFGYVFKTKKGKIVSFTGDSAMCESMEKMITSSNISFVDMAGTDISDKHFNIIDGIELMKKYEKKHTIVPCHLTSQALDYCADKIQPPSDLMVINVDDEKPYNFRLEKKDKKMKSNENFTFAKQKFGIMKGKMIELALSDAKIDKKTKLPTYFFDVLLPENKEIVGKVAYGVGGGEGDLHLANVEIDMTKDLDFRSVKYDCCLLIKKVALHHKENSLNLTCAPDDLDTRRVFSALGAFLKGVKTIATLDNQNNRTLEEKSIWMWEF